MRRLFFLCAIILCAPSLQAKVVLAPVFTDNMVLQQEASVTIWGTAAPGKKVTVTTSWNGLSYSTSASREDIILLMPEGV